MVGSFKDNSGLLFERVDGKLRDVLPHDLCGSRFLASLGEMAVGGCSHIRNHSFSRARVFLEVLFENGILLVLCSLFNFGLDSFWNEAR